MQAFISSFVLPLIIALISTGIIEYFVRRKKEYKITVSPLSLRSYQEKESGDVKISLSYKNEKVGDRLSVLSFRVLNEGKKDIQFDSSFEDPIKIECPPLQIVDMLIEKQSPSVGAKITVDGEHHALSWKLLKKKESIDIKMVGVCSDIRDGYTPEGLLKETRFIFRANNINTFDLVVSSASKFLRFFFIASLFFFGLLAAVVPMEEPPVYDVEVNGQRLESMSLQYNAYSKTYTVMSRTGRVVMNHVKLSDIMSLSPCEVEGVSVKTIVIWSLCGLYVLLIFFMLILRNRKGFYRFVRFPGGNPFRL